MTGIDLNENINFVTASFRHFLPHEKHITRISGDCDILLLVYNGVLRFEEENEAFELKSGQWHIQKRRTYQTGKYESDEPEYMYIYLTGRWVDEGKYLPADGEYSVPDMMPLMIELNRLMYSGGTTVEKNAVFYSILSKLYEQTPHKKNLIAEKAISILVQDVKRHISLDELSKELCYSKNHIIKVVKKEYGVTPYQFLQNYRLDYALRLLESTSLTVMEIVEETGFSDYTFFLKLFKKKLGTIPRRWREGKGVIDRLK